MPLTTHRSHEGRIPLEEHANDSILQLISEGGRGGGRGLEHLSTWH